MNIPIYAGSSSFFPGLTPFGFYDNDYQFQVDADKVVKFCAQRLGYPIQNVELQDINFYTAFEAAVTVYGNELYAYKLRDNILTLEGLTTSSNLNNALITPNLANIIRLSQQYGSEAGVGGNVTWFSGSISMSAGYQDYDLTDWAISQSITGGIEIKQIFYTAPPAVTRYFDPMAGTGMGQLNLLDAFGFGGMSPAINFMLMPVNYDLQVIQAIEFNDQIRRSQFTFQLINNKLRIFPIPNQHGKLWFNYIKLDDRLNSAIVQSPSKITNVSNAPYTNPVYTQINSIGRSWIFEYALCLCKEMLGYIRGKYQNIPIPNEEISLNQADLLASSDKEKTALIEKLRQYFDETSNRALLERRSQESEFRKSEISQVPMVIYIG